MGMLLDATPLRPTYGPAPVAPVITGSNALDWVKRQALVSGGTETDWASLMLAVRDKQDRNAFAQLFRHFAQRVKAFLMKAGSDAATAEECASASADSWGNADLSCS